MMHFSGFLRPIVIVLCLTLSIPQSFSKSRSASNSGGYSENSSFLLKIRQDSVKTVTVSNRGAVLNFPSKPTKVVIGNKGFFALEQIDSDLVISPLFEGAKANIFIYLKNRRYNLSLISSPKGHTLIEIRDPKESIFEADYE